MKQGHPLLPVAAVIIVTAFICSTALLMTKNSVPEFFGYAVVTVLGMITGLYIEKPRTGTRTRRDDAGGDE